MKCRVCNTEFEPTKERKIVVEDKDMLSGRKIFYDAFECPFCSCQNIACRHRKVVGSAKNG